MHKVVASAEEAIQDVFDGATIMVGGFGLCGNPQNLIRALVHKGVKNLTTISNNAGVDGFGVGLLLANGQIRRHIGTYVGENKLLEQLVLSGTVELDRVPQGTFSERIRAGGAGIPAFFTPTGVGTLVAESKEAREFDGRTYIMERALKADFAFIQDWKGERWGNLVYRKTARNFNPMMATAARTTVAEVEKLVELGELAARRGQGGRAAVRERPPRDRPLPRRGRRGPGPHQRGQADDHRGRGVGLLQLG